jgi:dextranase
MLQHYYDFLVEHDEVLMHPGLLDVTAAMAGDYNNDCDVTYPTTAVTATGAEGSVWRRITRLGPRLIIHLINLSGQSETVWDNPKQPPIEQPGGRLRFRAVLAAGPRVRVSEPQRNSVPQEIPPEAAGTHYVAKLPPLHTWQVVIVDLLGSPRDNSAETRS